MHAIRNSQLNYRLFSTSFREQIMKGMGLQKRAEVVIPDEFLPKRYANAVEEHR